MMIETKEWNRPNGNVIVNCFLCVCKHLHVKECFIYIAVYSNACLCL